MPPRKSKNANRVMAIKFGNQKLIGILGKSNYTSGETKLNYKK